MYHTNNRVNCITTTPSSGGNDKPVTDFLFVFGINNEIRKEYLGPVIENINILGFLMADTSSKRQKIYIYFVKYVTILLYIDQKSCLCT